MQRAAGGGSGTPEMGEPVFTPPQPMDRSRVTSHISDLSPLPIAVDASYDQAVTDEQFNDEFTAGAFGPRALSVNMNLTEREFEPPPLHSDSESSVDEALVQAAVHELDGANSEVRARVPLGGFRAGLG